jgi:kynurenine formamidase
MRLLIICALSTGVVCAAEHTTTKAEVERWMTELSNWGRWGKEDQLGTVNLITAAKRKEAAALVKEGIAISLSHDYLKEKAPDNSNPFVHKMLATGDHPSGDWFMDQYSVVFHGLAHTHMDSLAHTSWKGKMYNGFPISGVTDKGANKLGVTGFRNGIFSRGVLIDIPKLKGLPYLEPGTAIYPEDLDAWEKKTGVRISSGDVVLIRTGRWARRIAKGPWDTARVAGLHASTLPWLKKRDIAVMGSDACLDVLPSAVDDVVQPVHLITLVAMGTPIFDNFDFEALSAAAATRTRYTFLITAAPLTVVGGTGSPLNPIALF